MRPAAEVGLTVRIYQPRLICMDESALDRRVILLRALADPLRLKLLQRLHDRGETCVCELLAELGTTQSNISMHLRVLRQAELIRGQKIGKWVFYTLDVDELGRLFGALQTTFDPATAGGERPAHPLFDCCRAGDAPPSQAQAAERRTGVVESAGEGEP